MLSVKEQITNDTPFSDQSTLVLFWRKFGGSILHTFITGLYQNLHQKQVFFFKKLLFKMYLTDMYFQLD